MTLGVCTHSCVEMLMWTQGPVSPIDALLLALSSSDFYYFTVMFDRRYLVQTFEIGILYFYLTFYGQSEGLLTVHFFILCT